MIDGGARLAIGRRRVTLRAQPSTPEACVSEERIEALRKMAAAKPDDPRPRFGLALEFEKAGRWEDVVQTLRDYLQRADDEGNAWGRLGAALRHLGREDEAQEAYRKGVEAAYRHGHPTMAGEFEDVLDSW
ncbi:MAG TPA: tetratricopeptide repeat protein [Longimicrobium sp.]|nr:tetratricopeptide repeat protein [Longimicrobium sp.]